MDGCIRLLVIGGSGQRGVKKHRVMQGRAGQSNTCGKGETIKLIRKEKRMPRFFYHGS